MEIDSKLASMINAVFIDDDLVEFIGDNGVNIRYNGDRHLWYDNPNYYKVINPEMVSMPKKITIFSNIQETLFFLNKWKNSKYEDKFASEILICSSRATSDDLLQYLYERILIYNNSFLNVEFYHRKNSIDDIINIININNFFTTDKIFYHLGQPGSDTVIISSKNILNMPVSLYTMDMLLNPLIKYHIKNIQLRPDNYDFLLTW